MKVGDLVRWSPIEVAYHKSCSYLTGIDLTNDRKRGIIIDNNGINFFVQWGNGDFLAQKPNTIEVISESR